MYLWLVFVVECKVVHSKNHTYQIAQSPSLFQALCQCRRLKMRAGVKRGLVEKEGATGEPVSIVLKTSFRYTSSWYTL